MRRLLSIGSLIPIFAVVTALTVSEIAIAQDDDDDDDAESKAAARKLLGSGDKSLKAGDKLMTRGKKVEAQEAYLSALADYKAAYDAFSDSKIFFAIGLAEKKLGRYVDALNHFDRFLADVGGSETLRSRVEEHTDEIKSFLGVIFFRVDPDGAVVEINGDEVGKAPLNRPHYVPPGEHEYTISKYGFKTATGMVEVEAGEAREDEIILERDPSTDKKVDDDDDPKEISEPKIDKTPKKNRTPLIVGLALTGSFAIAGSVTGLLALSRHDTFTNDGSSSDDRDSARSSGKNLALATDVFLIGALAAATYTTYYYFAEYRGKPVKESPEPGVATIAPWLSDTATGVALSGSF